GPGSHFRDYLTASPYTNLLIEVDYIQGSAPDQTALTFLQGRLNERCKKPGGITIRVDNAIPATGVTTWRLSDLQALEAQYRNNYSAGNTAVIYLLYVNGGYDGDTSASRVLGLTYTGSSTAMFKDAVQITKGNPRTRGAVEDAVLTHECGHSLGLVGSGAPLTSQHDDPSH